MNELETKRNNTDQIILIYISIGNQETKVHIYIYIYIYIVSGAENILPFYQ